MSISLPVNWFWNSGLSQLACDIIREILEHSSLLKKEGHIFYILQEVVPESEWLEVNKKAVGSPFVIQRQASQWAKLAPSGMNCQETCWEIISYKDIDPGFLGLKD